MDVATFKPALQRRALARRELANMFNGYCATPPGWLWIEAGGLLLVDEDAWRKAGHVGDACPQALRAPLPSRAPARVQRNETLARASRAEIAGLERRHNASLPADYVAFLCSGAPMAPAERFFRCADETDDSVQMFFGASSPWPGATLGYAAELYAGAIPAALVPIASNGAGDFICLDLRQGIGAAGAVRLWRIRHFRETGEWREVDAPLIAEGFSAFLAGLRRALPTTGAAGDCPGLGMSAAVAAWRLSGRATA